MKLLLQAKNKNNLSLLYGYRILPVNSHASGSHRIIKINVKNLMINLYFTLSVIVHINLD